jgi:hypothetical protein
MKDETERTEINQEIRKSGRCDGREICPQMVKRLGSEAASTLNRSQMPHGPSAFS